MRGNHFPRNRGSCGDDSGAMSASISPPSRSPGAPAPRLLHRATKASRRRPMVSQVRDSETFEWCSERCGMRLVTGVSGVSLSGQLLGLERYWSRAMHKPNLKNGGSMKDAKIEPRGAQKS